MESKLFSYKQENYSLKSKLKSIQYDVESYKKYNNSSLGQYSYSSNNFYNNNNNNRISKDNNMKKKFIDISEVKYKMTNH